LPTYAPRTAEKVAIDDLLFGLALGTLWPRHPEHIIPFKYYPNAEVPLFLTRSVDESHSIRWTQEAVAFNDSKVLE
jgi:hypothetical protein